MQRSPARPASNPHSCDNRAAERRELGTEYALRKLAAVLLDITRNPRPSATVAERMSGAEAVACEPVNCGELCSDQENAPQESRRRRSPRNSAPAIKGRSTTLASMRE